MMPGKRRQLGKSRLGQLQEEIEHLKARLRARGEHAFRIVKRQGDVVVTVEFHKQG